MPSELPVDFWQRATEGVGRNVRMLVKRVFITDDLGDGFLPKWLSFLRIVVDGASRNDLGWAWLGLTLRPSHGVAADDLP